MKIFEPELFAFLNIKAIRAEYRVLSLQREIQALKSTVDNLIAVTSIPKNGLIGEQEKVEEVTNDEHLDSNDENPFADLVDKVNPEEGSVVPDSVEESAKVETEEHTKVETEVQESSEVSSDELSEEDENVVAIVQMDCEGNITGVIPNPVQEEIDEVQKVEGSSL